MKIYKLLCATFLTNVSFLNLNAYWDGSAVCEMLMKNSYESKMILYNKGAMSAYNLDEAFYKIDRENNRYVLRFHREKFVAPFEKDSKLCSGCDRYVAGYFTDGGLLIPREGFHGDFIIRNSNKPVLKDGQKDPLEDSIQFLGRVILPAIQTVNGGGKGVNDLFELISVMGDSYYGMSGAANKAVSKSGISSPESVISSLKANILTSFNENNSNSFSIRNAYFLGYCLHKICNEIRLYESFQSAILERWDDIKGEFICIEKKSLTIEEAIKAYFEQEIKAEQENQLKIAYNNDSGRDYMEIRARALSRVFSKLLPLFIESKKSWIDNSILGDLKNNWSKMASMSKENMLWGGSPKINSSWIEGQWNCFLTDMQSFLGNKQKLTNNGVENKKDVLAYINGLDLITILRGTNLRGTKGMSWSSDEAILINEILEKSKINAHIVDDSDVRKGKDYGSEAIMIIGYIMKSLNIKKGASRNDSYMLSVFSNFLSVLKNDNIFGCYRKENAVSNLGDEKLARVTIINFLKEFFLKYVKNTKGIIDLLEKNVEKQCFPSATNTLNGGLSEILIKMRDIVFSLINEMLKTLSSELGVKEFSPKLLTDFLKVKEKEDVSAFLKSNEITFEKGFTCETTKAFYLIYRLLYDICDTISGILAEKSDNPKNGEKTEVINLYEVLAPVLFSSEPLEKLFSNFEANDLKIMGDSIFSPSHMMKKALLKCGEEKVISDSASGSIRKILKGSSEKGKFLCDENSQALSYHSGYKDVMNKAPTGVKIEELDSSDTNIVPSFTGVKIEELDSSDSTNVVPSFTRVKIEEPDSFDNSNMISLDSFANSNSKIEELDSSDNSNMVSIDSFLHNVQGFYQKVNDKIIKPIVSDSCVVQLPLTYRHLVGDLFSDEMYRILLIRNFGERGIDYVNYLNTMSINKLSNYAIFKEILNKGSAWNYILLTKMLISQNNPQDGILKKCLSDLLEYSSAKNLDVVPFVFNSLISRGRIEISGVNENNKKDIENLLETCIRNTICDYDYSDSELFNDSYIKSKIAEKIGEIAGKNWKELTNNLMSNLGIGPNPAMQEDYDKDTESIQDYMNLRNELFSYESGIIFIRTSNLLEKLRNNTTVFDTDTICSKIKNMTDRQVFLPGSGVPNCGFFVNEVIRKLYYVQEKCISEIYGKIKSIFFEKADNDLEYIAFAIKYIFDDEGRISQYIKKRILMDVVASGSEGRLDNVSSFKQLFVSLIKNFSCSDSGKGSNENFMNIVYNAFNGEDSRAIKVVESACNELNGFYKAQKDIYNDQDVKRLDVESLLELSTDKISIKYLLERVVLDEFKKNIDQYRELKDKIKIEDSDIGNVVKS